MKSTRLNLGAGNFRKKGFINIDIRKEAKPDIIHDLNKHPYPFTANQFESIEADHVFEHLENPLETMRELHRILKPNGELIIRVPHFSRGFTHSDHKRGFDLSFPFYFNPKFTPGYIGVTFKLEKTRLKWFAQPYMKTTVLPKWQVNFGIILGALIDFFANAAPFFCSRIWCYYVGGFEELSFRFRKP